MKNEKKPVFELPKLIGLDGKEIDEDRLLQEITADQVCLGGGKTCTGGSKATLSEEDIV